MLLNQNTSPQPRQIVARLIRIARIERKLLAAETSENVTGIMKGIAAIVAALALFPVALTALSGWVLLLLIDLGYTATQSAGMTAAGLIAVLGIFAFTGWRILKHSSILPRRTISSLKQIVSNVGGIDA